MKHDSLGHLSIDYSLINTSKNNAHDKKFPIVLSRLVEFYAGESLRQRLCGVSTEASFILLEVNRYKCVCVETIWWSFRSKSLGDCHWLKSTKPNRSLSPCLDPLSPILMINGWDQTVLKQPAASIPLTLPSEQWPSRFLRKGYRSRTNNPRNMYVLFTLMY